MPETRIKSVIGARTIKTGLATFLTPLFCLWLNLIPIFAIFSVVFTIKPTLKSSLKKKNKRFSPK
ncbi:aromatic acid exporter family protein, partial [Staphylococcus hyicus]